MNTYFFNTTAVEKSPDFYIDRNIIPNFTCKAENIKSAIKQYSAFADKNCICISKTAAQRPEKMYVDRNSGAIQKGFVFTASTEVEFCDGWRKRFISLWTEVSILQNPFS